MNRTTISRACIAGALGAAFSLATIPCLADTLTKTNGQTLNGRVISEERDVVVFESNFGGLVMRQRVPRNQIKDLREEVREGPGYVALPIVGEIGVEVTADALRRAIGEARRYKPQFIVLSIDSLGGSVVEKEKIVDVIRQNARDVRFIAYVKRAVSAAAIVALACHEIYMAEDATIGATVTVVPVAFGRVQAADEKIQSMVRASDRAVALAAGHSELWVRGMSERDLELSVRTERGVTRLVEATGDPSERVIKRRGQILTLAAGEAVEYGLAKGTSPSLASIKQGLNLAAWHEAADGPWHSMINSGRLAREEIDRRARLGPEVSALNGRLGKATARMLAAEAVLAQLKRELNLDLTRLREQYDQKMEAASRSVAEQARIERAYAKTQKKIHDYYQNQIKHCETELEQARNDQKRLRDEMNALVGAN